MEMLPSESSGLTVDTVEWLPSGGATGLLRIRGRAGRLSPSALPVLVVGTGEAATQHLSLPEPGPRADGGAWRGAYILQSEVVEAGASLTLEVQGGESVAVPAPVVPPASVSRAVSADPGAGERGGEVIERAVLAERRARRAEEAEQAQARVAAEALKALEVLELRGSELERRIEELTEAAAADELREQLAEARAQALRAADEFAAARASAATELEAAQTAGAAAAARVEAERVALVAALDSAAGLREVVRAWAARFRSAEIARTSVAVRLAVLESRRGAMESELQAARAALAEQDRVLESLREQAGLAAITIEEAYGAAASARDALVAAVEEQVGLRAELAGTRSRLEAVELELSAEQEARQILAVELEEAKAATASARDSLREARSVAAGAQAELRVERVARTTLAAELADERRRGATSGREAAQARAALALAEERVRSANGARAELAAALDAANARIASLESERGASPGVPGPATAPAGSPVDADALARRALSLRRDRGEVAAEGPADGGRLRRDLDAAAAALRARTPEPPAEPGAPVAVVSVSPAPALPAPRLRDVLIESAVSDPATAARLLAGLLLAQGVLLGGRCNYDLTIAELGTFAITVTGGGVATVRRLDAPRPRLLVDFRVVGTALGLARLLAGSGRPLRRFGGSVRLMGLKGGRARDVVQILESSALSVAAAARAGARLEPGDVFGALPFAIEPSWTAGHAFTVAFEVTGEGAGTWLVMVADGAPVVVATSGATPSATVVLPRGTFDALLRDEPAGAGQRPRIRGDRRAVGLLKGWTDRARGVVDERDFEAAAS